MGYWLGKPFWGQGIMPEAVKEMQDLKIKTRVEKAGVEDIDSLVALRLDYLVEDNGSIDKNDAEKIREALPDYYRKHLNNDLFVYVIRNEKMIVSCAFLLVVEKPMSPAFINGKTGIILNVFTGGPYRRKGYARMIMDVLLAEAKDMGVLVIDLKSTEDGYSLYRSVGFQDDHSKYHLMKWKNQ